MLCKEVNEPIEKYCDNGFLSSVKTHLSNQINRPHNAHLIDKRNELLAKRNSRR
jgi:hypothetical protein